MSRVAILGTGLIGGSIGLGLMARGSAVTGYDRDPSVVRRAVERGAIQLGHEDPRPAVEGADLVVVAVPLGHFQELLERIGPHLAATSSVTDVASAKAAVVEAGERILGDRFIGGHPMAGSERRGIDAANGELFRDAAWILTPTSSTASSSYAAASQLATSLGARVVAVDATEHDRLVARLSHLPQIAASALVHVASTAGDRDALLGLAGGGFRDVTRIAASDPDLWVSILRTNKDAVLASLARVGDSLQDTAAVIREGRWDELRSWLQAARDARVGLFAKPDFTGEPIALSMIVPDRPGVLAEVTTEAGKIGANIEDLRIVHSTEGGRGRLELVVAGREPAEELAMALEALGYHVEHPTIDFST